MAESSDLKKLQSFLQFKNPPLPWYVLPPFPQPRSPGTDKILWERRKWQTQAKSSEPALFLSTVPALLKKTNSFLKTYVIKKDQSFDMSALITYRERAFVERPGDFSIRGFLMDIYSPAYKTPLRIELVGSKVQSIHLLDKLFKKRQIEMEKALIPPLYEWSWTVEDRKKLCQHFKGLEPALPYGFFKSVARGNRPEGFEVFLNYWDKTCSLDCFLDPPQLWFFEPEKAKAQFMEERILWEKEQSPIHTENIFLDFNYFEKKIVQYQKDSRFSAQQNQVINLRAFSLKKDSSERQKPSFLKSFSSSLFKKTECLREDLLNLPARHIVFVGESQDELKKLLLKEQILNPEDEDFFCGKNLIFLKGHLRESFFCPGETAYLQALSLLPKKDHSSRHFDFFRQKARAIEFSQLEEGDLLVHIQYGVGEFVGLKSLPLQGQFEDFIVLKYKAGDQLFVPAYRASQVKCYARKRGSAISKTLLDQLGRPQSWERKKSKAKKHIQSLAIELMEIYKMRKQKTRPPFAKVQEALACFAKKFLWKETKDQSRAIQEIMADMDSPQPMDRLLAGDTGFGKTEVALRAIFRALENGFQVCLLAPTTVLALQHFKNFQQRFKDYPFELALLSRFSSLKQREKLFQEVKTGRVDLLIATHSVFSSKLFFKNLRLLVVDEEHRFGVRQKERLLRSWKNLDVLSLSATPIPRTLNMALTGIKDISVISEPPPKRKPVQIILKTWTSMDDIIRACKKEKARGGQILFVHNRIKTLFQRLEQLQSRLPHFRIVTAQGQSPGLDKIMLDFFEKKYDMLVSTNIIESGMDLPQANTLFIDRAHEMGLSQIYQLKGRVGRGQEEAYCYLLFPAKDRLSVLAKERLSLLEKYAGLGLSFQLALKDLENRGAGSLFGSEQSGHLQNLGEELYFEILNEQLRDQKKIVIEPEISLPFDSHIPSNYIPDPRLRLLYYKSLSEAEEPARQNIERDLLEDFGPIPIELNHLFFLLKIRDFCKKLLIRDFKIAGENLYLSWHEKTSVSPEKILKLIEDYKGQMLSPQNCKIPLSGNGFMEDVEKILCQLS